MSIAKYFLGFFLTFGVAQVFAQAKATDLYVSGTNGYEHYRIPSLLTTEKGILLAFCEARKRTGDAGDIDLVMKRSLDGGRTWSDERIIWDDGMNTCGNPCPVVDEETGTIWLLMTHNIGSDKESDIIRKKSQGTRTVWVCSSNDNGATWSVPVNITSTTKDLSWGWYATGPGVGIQIKNGPHKGRLVIPCDHSYDDPQGSVRNGPFEYGSHIIYSDDHGQTWQLGGTIRPKVNECQVVELADGNGSLLMDMRSYFGRNRRTQSVSRDGGLTWTSPTDAHDLIEPVCQASLIRYSWPNLEESGKILFLNPASTSARENLTLRASFDDGKSWPYRKVIHSGPSAYSSISVLPNGSIGCLYEAGANGPYERIIFQVLERPTFD